MIFRKNNRFYSKANIELTDKDTPNNGYASLNDISIDGLSFQSGKLFMQGTLIDIEIPITFPKFQAKAEVVWCSPNESQFDVGVKFLSIEKGFRIKTVEQLRILEKHKMKVFFEEGRIISYEQANQEVLSEQRQSFN